MKRILLEKAVMSDFTYLLGKEIVSVEQVHAGIMNIIFKGATKDEEKYYFKQALGRPYVKNAIRLDFNFINQDRLKVEYECLLLLGKELHHGKNYLTPKPILFDEDNYVLVTKDLIMPTSLLTDLEQGIFNIGIAMSLGNYLHFQHSRKISNATSLRKGIQDKEHWRYFLSLRTLDLLNNKEYQVVEGEIRNLYDKGMLFTNKLLIHTDYCPKNILLKGRKVAILDFELASGIGDPAYDLGFMIGHYLLYACISKRGKEGLKASEAMYDSYIENTDYISKEFRSRTWKYAGCTILYRLKGASPLQSVNPLSFEKLKMLGIKLVSEKNE